MTFWDTIKDSFSNVVGAGVDVVTYLPKAAIGGIASGFTGAKVAQSGQSARTAKQAQYAVEDSPLIQGTATDGASSLLLALDVPYQQTTVKSVLATAGKYAGIPKSARKQIGITEQRTSGVASPGQALFAAASRALPGEQGADKIDWTNQDEIDKYFKRWGIPKIITGALDFGLRIFGDPTIIGAKYSKIATNNIFTRPIVGNVERALKRDAVLTKEVDAAVAGLNSPAKPLIDRIMNDYDSAAQMMVGEPLIYKSNNPDGLSAAFWQAREYGPEAVGDVLKISWGNEAALRKIQDRYDALAKTVEDVQGSNQFYLDRLNDPVNLKQPYWSTAQAESYIAQNNAFLKEAAKENSYLESILRGKEELDIPSGTPNVTVSAIRSSVRTQTWAKYEALEKARGKVNLARANSYWDNQLVPTKGGKAVRVMSWVDESSVKKQAPSGHIAINQRGVADTYSEALANIRMAQSQAKLSPQWAEEKFSQWMRLENKADRREWLQNFERESLFAMFRSKFDITDFNDKQLIGLRQLTDELMQKHIVLRHRANQQAANNNFMVIDDTGDTVIAEGLKQFVKKYADDFNMSVSAAKQALTTKPMMESQVPDFYQMVDFRLYSRLIDENPTIFENLIEDLRRVPDPTVRFAKRLANEQASILGQKQAIRPEKIRALSVDAADYAVDVFNAIWKPTVLMRLAYGIRNVSSGTGRMLAFGIDQSMTMGWKYTGNMLVGIGGYYARVPKYGAKYVDTMIRRNIAMGKLKISEGKLRGSITTDDEILAKKTSLFNAHERSVKAEMAVLNRLNKTKIRDIRKALADSKKELTKDTDAFITKLEDYLSDTPDDIFDINRADEMIQALFNTDDLKRSLDVISFWKSNSLQEAKMLEDLLDAVSSNQKPKKLADVFEGFMSEGFRLSPIELQGVTNIMNLRLEQARLLAELQVTATARAAKLGKLDLLISKTDVQRIYNGSKSVKVFDDVEMDGAFGGWIGDIARGDVSAMNTIQQTFVTSNRGALSTLLDTKATRAEITPDNPDWSRSWAEYINNQVRNDKVMVQFAEGKYDEEVVEWLGTKAAEQYRRVQRYAIDGTFSGNLESFVKFLRLQFEKTLPPIGDLRKKFLEGKVSPTDGLRLPEDLRATVPGVEIAPGELSFAAVWQSGVNAFFKVFGSAPEDIFNRNPLYIGVYNAELKRQSALAAKQGTDIGDANVQESIMRSARRTALKVVEENLYTVRRYTGPAEQLRAFSPFYMAGQNEARFWLGAAVRNPLVPYLGILGLNSVNRAFEVRDADEYNKIATPYSFPFNTGESVWLPVPQGLAKALGVPASEYLKISKDSMNVWLQGEGAVFSPQFGPLVQLPTSVAFKYLSGSKIDPDRELTRLGDAGGKIKSYLMPQGRPMTSSELLNAPRWIQSLEIFRNPSNSPDYWNAVDVLVKEKQLEFWNKGEVITNDMYNKIFNDSSSEARKMFLWDSVFRFGAPASTRWGSGFELMRSEYFLYQERFGRVVGAAEFEKKYGTPKYVLASSSLSYNPGGITSTPQTVRNYVQNKELFRSMWTLAPEIAGQLINAGTVNDFSAVADEKIRGITVGGKKIKGTEEDLIGEAKNREISVGWGEYIPKLEVLNAQMLQSNIRPNTKAAEPFEAEKRRLKAEIGAKYPAWGVVAMGSPDLAKKANRITAIYSALNNSKFMNSSQGKSDLWKGLLEYAVQRELLRAEIIKRDGTITTGSIDRVDNQDIVSALNYERIRIGAKYPTFFDFSERYLDNDNLAFSG